MICLLTLIFGIGGSTLISTSFQTALERETESARKSYQLMLSTLQMVDRINGWWDSSDVSNTLKQLSSQGLSSWSDLTLSSDSKMLYKQGSATEHFIDISSQVDTKHDLITYFTDSQGKQYLQISSAFMIENETLYLNIGYDISPIYEARSQQLETYYKFFFVMIILCAILAYSASCVLTRPLASLSKASKEIASGNLAYRSKISSNDEIGSLSSDFDTMAEQVEKSVLELKSSMERQERFMGSFAHEMKTPMTSIIGYADLIRGQILTPEEQTEAANYIFLEGKRMESLSLKLLDIFVTDKRDIKLESLSPSQIIKDLVEHLQPIYEKEQITLRCECEEGYYLLEQDLIVTLLINLLDNARKSLEGGGHITVYVKMIPEGCQISVKDNGKGIPSEALKHLTEAFYRVDKSRSRAQGGFGLGLTLCAKIVELHHGTIRIESQQGLGTNVIVELKGGKL